MKRLSPCLLLLALLCSACTGIDSPPMQRTFVPPPAEAELVKVRVVAKPRVERAIPVRSRIVLTDFEGDCAIEVRDALMQRLVDNADYDVVTRSFLDQILAEAEQAYAGDFNTDTAIKIGDLMAASVFVVGRVAYCGSPDGRKTPKDGFSNYNIQAVLQILDIRTGRVLISSSAEGNYFPDSTQLMLSTASTSPTTYDAKAGAVTEDQPAPPNGNNKQRIQKFGRRLASAIETSFASDDSNHQTHESPQAASAEPQGTSNNSASPKAQATSKTVNFPALKAAEDLANSFADKFFARPTWEDVLMWTSPRWSYGESIRYVKLGRCDNAVDILVNSSHELSEMDDADIGNYLHNLGVALICDNKIEPAVTKLRSAHRITYDLATLEMIELASKLTEWSLTVEVDDQPEIDVLAKRVTEQGEPQVENSPTTTESLSQDEAEPSRTSEE